MSRQAVPNNTAVVKVWLVDKTFKYFYGSVHGNKLSDSLKCTDTGSDFYRNVVYVVLPREIFINVKPKRFTVTGLVYLDAVNIDVYFLVI